ncbi:hypothetical protein SERLA73DRAFT_179601 [Serpula lacrymans var. lacrymans S7.3]|uniref:Uncharacterized protein n=2 Tax=Serpula lacrymans var. lacrymans TaxID=341189 RepID=F8PVU0_SERL3|nr:uncharacterized protein SERLADRAFT_464788 [Serpula lacrymans var. lacrymans S7.9]EGN99536.1 hypothetical protein SERLA73DRAFT_179601 [Serpula lacrymans var. lacrymans S7.3]EGO25106.1 hypothetical protein SERLADRAFT_464788 [Serpula lacrymans var. lacrymans S7.9]
MTFAYVTVAPLPRICIANCSQNEGPRKLQPKKLDSTNLYKHKRKAVSKGHLALSFSSALTTSIHPS